MITVYQLKTSFQNLLRPLVKFLAKIGVTANQITVLALMLSIVTGVAMWYTGLANWTLLCLPAVLFIRMGLNAIDGMLAREHDMKSTLGAILNELGDVISDTALYIPFAFLAGVVPELVIAVVIFAILSEMTGVIGVQVGASRRYDGPMGKSDRAFVFGLLGLLLGLGLKTGLWFNIVMGIIFFLLLITIFNRSVKAIREVNK